MGEALIALLALTAMEIVLGIDNIVFITIITGRLPESQRHVGLSPGTGGGPDSANPALVDPELDSESRGTGLSARVLGIARSGFRN